MDKSVGSLLAGGAGAAGAARPPSPGVVDTRVGGFVEQAGLDLQRVLAAWGGPQNKLGEQTVRALTGIGLSELAATPPADLLRIVAGHRPSGNDPSGWWGELTAGQGLGEDAEQELRKAIDTDGRKGLERTIATYGRLLQDATDAQKVLRDAIFTTIHEAAQRVAGPAFDPARLPGGDPFVLLSEHVGDWPRVVAAMKSGHGVLEVFRQIEDARQERLIRTEAPPWMGRMLAALWVQRQNASGVPGNPGGAEEAGAVDHARSGRLGSTMPGRTGSTMSGHMGGTMPGHPGNVQPGNNGNAASVHPTYTVLAHQGLSPSGHTGNAPSGHQGNQGNQGNAPSGHLGNQGNQGNLGHQGNLPPGHQGNPPSGHQGNQGNLGHQGNQAHQGNPPSGHQSHQGNQGHQGNPPSGHQGGWDNGHHGHGSPPSGLPWMPPPVHHGNGHHGHGSSPPGLPWMPPPVHHGNGHHGHGSSPPGLPWMPPPAHHGGWEHGHHGHGSSPPGLPWMPPPGHHGPWNNGHHEHPFSPPGLPWMKPAGHHGPWNNDRPSYRPWGHQRTWESAHGYWRHQPHHVPGHAGPSPWGHQRTWGSARDYWRHNYGYGGGHEYGRDFWRYTPGRPHHHTPIGKVILSALLPFPFNMLLGAKSHHDEVRHEHGHGFWHRSPGVFRHDPFRAIWHNAIEHRHRAHPEPVREVVWREPPVREVVWREPPVREIVVDVDVRPRPLYHLSFGRPMSEHELRRYLTVAPQLCAHPDGVLAEMAGLHGQARDVRGIDATTGEYLLLPGETLADVAHKLVGDRRRWRELEAANPLRAEGDPRLRIPPSWFGYVPYSIPLDRVRELRELRELRREEDEVDGPDELEAGDAAEAGDDAGYPRDRYTRRGRRRRWARRYAPMQGFGSFAAPRVYWGGWGGDPNGGELDEDLDDLDDAGGPAAVAPPRRRYRVTHFDALGTQSPTYTRETAEQIVMQHKLFDGHHVLRPDWWAELRAVNPQKPLNAEGWWRDIREGEMIWIPEVWPAAKPEPGPESTETAGVWDALEQLNPFAAPLTGNGAPAPAPLVMPEMTISGTAANPGSRQATTHQTYSVVRGDWPEKIAQRFGAHRRAHWLSELQRANPHKEVNRTSGNWAALYANEVVNIPDAWGSTDTGEVDDADAGALRENLTQRTYSVVANDGMQRIAQKLGAASRGSWFGELRDANPHKKMATNAKGKQLAWQSLYPGEIVNIPDAWPNMPQLRPAPGGAPTQAPYPGLSQFPAFPGGAVPSPTAPPGTVPAAATVDPGTILRVQAILIAFRQVHPEAIVPKDFGTGVPFSPDATGVLSPRTQQALASFQRWSNSMSGTRLRSDGVLDPDTIAALDSFSAQAIGGLTQRPAAAPIPGADPASGDGNPFAGILGAAAASVGEIARRAAPPVPPPASGDAPDPFAGMFGAAGDFMRNLGGSAQPSLPPARQRPRPQGDFEPRRAPPMLDELPGALQQYGFPGVPGLPGGAPHAPPPRRPRIDVPPAPPPPDEPYDAPQEPPAPPAPATAKPTTSDETVIPLVLAGLGVVSGFFV